MGIFPCLFTLQRHLWNTDFILISSLTISQELSDFFRLTYEFEKYDACMIASFQKVESDNRDKWSNSSFSSNKFYDGQKIRFGPNWQPMSKDHIERLKNQPLCLVIKWFFVLIGDQSLAHFHGQAHWYFQGLKRRKIHLMGN